MKLIKIFFIFIAQTHGSWIGEFENAMSSLQNGFQRLITDVVTDVKDTIDCTVVAVENALSLGVNDSLYRKCKGVALPKANEYKNDEGKSLKFIGNKHMTDNLHEDISKHLENPLSSIEDKIRHKNQGLKSLNAYLKSELDSISSSVDDELKRIDKDEKSTVDSVIQYINKIHSVEHAGNSSSEVKEIEKILNRPLVTEVKYVKSNNSNNAKINDIIARLGQQSNNKNKGSNNKNIQSTLTMLEEHNISQGESSQTHQRSIKDFFEKNAQDKNKSEEFQYTANNIKHLPSHSLEEDVKSMDRIFGGSSTNSESHNGLLDEARKLVEESERSSSILNNLFQKVDQSGKNIFDTL